MSLVKKMEQWKKDLTELNNEKIKAEGRLEQAMAELKKAGFDSLEDAKAELDKRMKDKSKLEETAEDMMVRFKEKYSDFIEA